MAVPFWVQMAGAVGAGFTGAAVLMLPDTGSPSAAEAMLSNCNIKGNISFNGGQRIYHVPGQEFYTATVISPERGERWFCTEAEARAAGWRAATR